MAVHGTPLDHWCDGSPPTDVTGSPSTLATLQYWHDGTPEFELNQWVTGPGAATLASDTAAGSGSVVDYPGTGEANLAAVTAAGSGVRIEIGTGDCNLAPDTASGEGTASEAVVGTGAANLAPVTAQGTGIGQPTVEGTGAAYLFPPHPVPSPLAQSPAVDWPDYSLFVPQPHHAWYLNKNFKDTPKAGKTALNLTKKGAHLAWVRDWANRVNKSARTNWSSGTIHSYLTRGWNADISKLGNTFTLIFVFGTGADVTTAQTLFDTSTGATYAPTKGVRIRITTQGKLLVEYPGIPGTGPSFSLIPNKNYYVVITQENGECKIYVNGAYNTHAYIAGPIDVGTGPFTIMAGAGGTNPLTYHWQLYGLMAFKGTALYLSQIQTLHDTWVQVGALYKHHPYAPVTYQPPPGQITADGDGLLGPFGEGDADLAEATASGAGNVGVGGIGAAWLAPMTADGTGDAQPKPAFMLGYWHDGEPLELALYANSVSTLQYWHDGEPEIDLGLIWGALVTVLPQITAAGTGTFTLAVLGSGAAVLPEITADGWGFWVLSISGTGEAVLTRIQANGSGWSLVTGTGAAWLIQIQAAGSGWVVVTGTGDAQIAPITAAGTGARGVAGTGAANLSPVVAAGSGWVVVIGTGAAWLAQITAGGLAFFGFRGIGAAVLEPVTAEGEGVRGVVGSGAAVLSPVTAAGAGHGRARTLREKAVLWLEAEPITDLRVRAIRFETEIEITDLRAQAIGWVETEIKKAA